MTTTEQLQTEINAVVRKRLYPSPLMHWMEGLTQAERIGRIKRSKYSVLRYSIRQFLVTQVSGVTQGTAFHVDYTFKIMPMDDEIVIRFYNEEDDRTLNIPYPDWLLDFLDDDENFALMLPDDDNKSGEVIQRIYEWCLEHPPYDILVRPS